MFSLRVGASLTALALLLPAGARAGEEEKLSALSKISVAEKKEGVAVTVVGTKAPDFTSFTMSNPFRVVVDWAGSRIDGAPGEQTFERGLIRAVRTKQYDSEAERISRVTIELSRQTSYHVDASGTKVTIHFEPVADPIPEPERNPKPEPVAKKEEKQELVYVPEGPLTEPDLPVPENPPLPPKPAPVVVAKVEPKKVEPKKVEATKVEPKKEAPAPVLAKVEPAKVEPKKEAPKPEPVVVAAVEPKQEKIEPAKRENKIEVAKAEPKKAEPPKVEPPKVEPKPEPVVVAKAEPKTKAAPKTEPVKPEPKPEPVVVAKAEPKKLEPKKEAPKARPQPRPKEEPKQIASYVPKVRSPRPKAVRKTPAQRTRQIASSAPKSLDSGWAPPGAGRVRGLPVVRYGVAQETIQPDGETPVDPDEPATSGGGDDDFDPGPRLMKYIGFRQMANVSRVFVRLDGKAKYKQKREGDTVVVELVDTSVPIKNNTRPLDTSYFNSPVGNVQAVPTGDSTRIEIKLKEQVPFKVKRIGTTIAIDFTRK